MIDLIDYTYYCKVNIHWSENQIEDLKDDIIENFDKHLYEFIRNDLEKAFYTGYLLKQMLYDDEELEVEQYLLYSREFRHKGDDLDKYESQIEFWENKYKSINEKPKLLDILEFIINNMFYYSMKDAVNICLKFGEMTYNPHV